MLKKFPDSYPYCNKKGVLITKRQVDDASREMLETAYSGSEKGLEIARALLYAIEEVEDATKLARLAKTVLPQASALVTKELKIKREDAMGQSVNLGEARMSEEVSTRLSEDASSVLHPLKGLLGEDALHLLWDLPRWERHMILRKIRKQHKTTNKDKENLDG